ncbi:hypothetical protein O1L68_04065 [Streptomyces lydicus]|nr:hypothetical protein [Streptomyces lydicus]
MLDAGLDLEADLSVDSIKRVEIIGALADRIGLPQDADGAMESAVEQLSGSRPSAASSTGSPTPTTRPHRRRPLHPSPRRPRGSRSRSGPRRGRLRSDPCPVRAGRLFIRTTSAVPAARAHDARHRAPAHRPEADPPGPGRSRGRAHGRPRAPTPHPLPGPGNTSAPGEPGRPPRWWRAATSSWWRTARAWRSPSPPCWRATAHGSVPCPPSGWPRSPPTGWVDWWTSAPAGGPRRGAARTVRGLRTA